jgi:threonine/homoserine efflux transporter RhtA
MAAPILWSLGSLYSRRVRLPENIFLRVATYTYINPIVAVALGWFILREPVTPLMLAAMVIIVLAVILITAQRPKKAVTAQPVATLPPSLAANPSPSMD